MRMGASDQDSVLDADAQARGVDGLYVADNSALANGLGGPNPTLTTQALATRAAEYAFTTYFGGEAWALDQLTTHLAARREARVDATEPTGLLTHHRALSPPAWAWLDALLGRLRGHPAVSFLPLDPLLGDESPSQDLAS